MKDWRLQGQEKYLNEAVLKRKKYRPYRRDWQHDHCEFCGAEFSLENTEALQEGYTTSDHYRWICVACFRDFKTLFSWVVALDTELQGIFIPESDLPHPIFVNTLGRYLFFDIDVRSSDILISTLYQVAKTCLGTNLDVHVFACSDRNHLARLNVESNWVAEINAIHKALDIVGDCDGLILVDASRKWVVYQKRPVDIGIFAFDGTSELLSLESAIADCFFGCRDIAKWLTGKSPRDISLVNQFGSNYLAALLKNYGTSLAHKSI
jgi:hypothetical protein